MIKIYLGFRAGGLCRHCTSDMCVTKIFLTILELKNEEPVQAVDSSVWWGN